MTHWTVPTNQVEALVVEDQYRQAKYGKGIRSPCHHDTSLQRRGRPGRLYYELEMDSSRADRMIPVRSISFRIARSALPRWLIACFSWGDNSAVVLPRCST